MKIYTKTGDSGETGLMGGKRVRKDDPYMAALGTIDELNSFLGVTITHLQDEDHWGIEIKAILERVQHELFTLGAEVAASVDKPVNAPKITLQHIESMERIIDEYEAQLRIPQHFILPGGTKTSAFLHLCRTVARRAEREVVTLSSGVKLNPDVIRYLNRLSDMLYVLARYANRETETKEQQPIYKYLGQG
jgi:cob(I)alamin adenosyltransferase